MNLDQFLQKIPLFSGVSPEVVSRFKASLAGPQKIPPSSILATRGALVEHLFFIATGSLSVTITRYKRGLESSSDDRHSSRTLMLEAFYPGELVGDLELTSELPRWNADVVVLEEAVIYCIRKEALAMILASSPQLIFNLYRADLVRIRQSEQALVDTAFYLVEKRLFERLVFLLLQQGEAPVELDSLVGVVLEDMPTHTQLAQFFGCTRETITNLFTLFRNRGYITTEKVGRNSCLQLTAEGLRHFIHIFFT